MESALAGALAGWGGCAVLTGEAGIGKSRLIRELARIAADRQVPVIMGRVVPASTSAPYQPVTEALLQLLRRRPLPDDRPLAPWRAVRHGDTRRDREDPCHTAPGLPRCD